MAVFNFTWTQYLDATWQRSLNGLYMAIASRSQADKRHFRKWLIWSGENSLNGRKEKASKKKKEANVITSEKKVRKIHATIMTFREPFDPALTQLDEKSNLLFQFFSSNFTSRRLSFLPKVAAVAVGNFLLRFIKFALFRFQRRNRSEEENYVPNLRVQESFSSPFHPQRLVIGPRKIIIDYYVWDNVRKL